MSECLFLSLFEPFHILSDDLYHHSFLLFLFSLCPSPKSVPSSSFSSSAPFPFSAPNFFSPSCPSSLYPRPLLRLLLLPSQGPFYPSSDSSGSSVPPPSSLSSYTSVSPPLFPSSALSFRFFLLSFTSLSSRCCPVLPMLQQPLLLPLHLFFFRPLSFISFHCSLFSFLFLLPILPLPYLLFLLPLFLCSFFFLCFLIVLSFVSSLYSKTRLITQTSRIRDAIYKPHEGT